MLLVGDSLLAESLWSLVERPLGFEPEHLLTVRVVLPWNTRPRSGTQFLQQHATTIEISQV